VTPTHVVHSIVLAWGWRRALIAFGAGAAATLALAPFDIWPVMFVTFSIVVWLIDGAAGRWDGVTTAAATGWWFGFGYFLAGLYWVGYAFLVDAKIFGWLLPFAVLALPAGLAVFTALGFALARFMWTPGTARILVLAAALAATEWLRGHVLSGFPWNAFGYALTGPLVLAQSAALVGLWGLTFIAVAVFAAPAVMADERKISRPWLAPACAAVVLAALAGSGAVRLARTPTTFVEDVRLRIMQPNVQQDEKFNYSAKDEVMKRYVALSDRATGPRSMGVRDATHLIWPESAFPFFLTREADAMAAITKLLPAGSVLITGAARLADTNPNPQYLRAYNSIYVIDHDGSILSVYDKVHLVPFGEYLPFQDFLEGLGLTQLTKVQGGFLSGDRRRTMNVPRAPGLLPLICYEIIFPGDAVPAGERPGWLVNLTNDGWFGVSTGPYQHFQQARIRAVEEGLPLVRAANTGISAVVDPLGRVIKSLPLGTEGVLDSGLPGRIDSTVYRRIGDGPTALILGAILMAGLVRRLRRG
jgi:apolipoprotein N-acyltransferase